MHLWNCYPCCFFPPFVLDKGNEKETWRKMTDTRLLYGCRTFPDIITSNFSNIMWKVFRVWFSVVDKLSKPTQIKIEVFLLIKKKKKKLIQWFFMRFRYCFYLKKLHEKSVFNSTCPVSSQSSCKDAVVFLSVNSGVWFICHQQWRDPTLPKLPHELWQQPRVHL